MTLPDGRGPDGSQAARPTQVAHAWHRAVVGWHVAFWVVVALGLVTVLAEDRPDVVRWVTAAAFASMGLAYLLVSRPLAHPERWRGYTYLGVAITGTGAVCSADPSLAYVLFIVYPQVWLFARGIRVGTALTVTLSATVVVGFLNSMGWRWQTLRDVAPEMLASMAFSILLGWWIYRVIDQSLERADLIAQLEATRAELAAAHHAQGVMAERERVAREIHDTLAQGFTSVVMLSQAAGASLGRDPAQVAEDLSTIEAVARENLAEARALVGAFTPVGLDGSTLPDAVRRLAERFGRETGVEVDVEIRDSVAGLRREQEVVLLRTVQEALTNVRRHAAASRVAVLLLADADGARVEVRDDGTGFEQSTATGFGLSGMRSRVAEAGGVLDIASAPGAGTRVVVRLPALGAP